MTKKNDNIISDAINALLAEAEVDIQKEYKVVDVISFCENEQYLNFLKQDPPLRLWPMQKIALKLFYRGTRGNEHLELDQQELDILEDIRKNEDLDYCEDKGGFVQIINKYKRRNLHNQLLLVMGRRSSKTMLVSIIAAYEAYKLLECPEGNPHKYYNVSPDKPLAILNVAVSEAQAYDPLFKEIQSRIARAPYFSNKINHSATTNNIIYLLTDADKRENALRKQRKMSIILNGSVVLKSGHSNSASLRGQASICILFDEFAHFLNSSGKQSGDEVYNALVPSTRQFGIDGKVVLLSDPRGKDGMFWKLFTMSQEQEVADDKISFLNEEILALQLPTWRMNPNKEFSKDELFRTERHKDPIAFWSTWNARFQGETGEKLFSEQKIIDSIDWNRSEIQYGDPKYSYFIHLDPATNNHNYALVMVHLVTLTNKNGEVKRKVVVDQVKFWPPTKEGRIKIEVVEKTIRELCKRFNVKKVTFDTFQSAQTIERLIKSGIKAEETPYINSFITKIYGELRNIINEGDLIIYPHEQLIGELKNIRFKLISRGLKRMPDPKSEFPYDDCCDALAGATFQALSTQISRSLPRSAVVYMGMR